MSNNHDTTTNTPDQYIIDLRTITVQSKDKIFEVPFVRDDSLSTNGLNLYQQIEFWIKRLYPSFPYDDDYIADFLEQYQQTLPHSEFDITTKNSFNRDSCNYHFLMLECRILQTVLFLARIPAGKVDFIIPDVLQILQTHDTYAISGLRDQRTGEFITVERDITIALTRQLEPAQVSFIDESDTRDSGFSECIGGACDDNVIDDLFDNESECENKLPAQVSSLDNASGQSLIGPSVITVALSGRTPSNSGAMPKTRDLHFPNSSDCWRCIPRASHSSHAHSYSDTSVAGKVLSGHFFIMKKILDRVGRRVVCGTETGTVKSSRAGFLVP